MSCRCGHVSLKYWGELEVLQKRYPSFQKNDLYKMIEWFHTHSIDGSLTCQDFVEAMGFTSHAGYMFERVFSVIDKYGKGKVFSMLL